MTKAQLLKLLQPLSDHAIIAIPCNGTDDYDCIHGLYECKLVWYPGHLSEPDLRTPVDATVTVDAIVLY
jgi:hypothetical protein